MTEKSPRSSLLVNLTEIPETILVPAQYLAGGTVGAKIAYGRDMSIMVATRQPGYHSKPHRHDAEQLNYVMDGELFVFVGEFGFLARKGDLFRIPRNAVHWSWVQGCLPCILLEAHAPPLTADPGVLETAIALIDEVSGRPAMTGVGSEWPTDVDSAAVERRVMTAAGARQATSRRHSRSC